MSSILYKDAMNNPPFHTSFHNGNFTLTNFIDPPTILPLTKICTMVHQATVNFIAHIEAALPLGATMMELPLHLLTDDFSAIPLHCQPSNSQILHPFLTDYWNWVLSGPSGGSQPLFNSAGLVRVEADKWLAQYDACFPHAACAIMLTSGCINDHSFRHQQYAGPDRTVFLLKNGNIALVNPLSSGRKIGRCIDLIMASPDVSRCLLTLITILLPIASALRGLKGQTNPLHSTHLWVVPHRRTTGECKWGYDANTTNSVLTPLSQKILGISLTGKTLSKMTLQLFYTEFPLIFHNSMPLRSPVDDLAQHLYSTGLRAYGRLTNFPSFKHLTSDKAIRHLTLCEIWQALTKCGPINDWWKGMVIGSTLFPVEYFPGMALRLARRLVLCNYEIHKGHSSEERRHLVSELLSRKPFLQGIDVS